MDPDPHRAHSAQSFHASAIVASASSLPSKAAAQSLGLAQNIPDVTFDSHNNSKSGVPSDRYNQMRLNFVEPAVTNNQVLSSISNEACTSNPCQFSKAVRGAPGSLNKPSGPYLGLSQGRNSESSGSSPFSEAVQDVPGSFNQPSGSHLRLFQDVGGQDYDLGSSGTSQSGPDQVSETAQGLNQPRGPHLGLNQPSGSCSRLSQNFAGQSFSSGSGQFPGAARDVHGSSNQPSGSYLPVSSTVDQQSYDSGSPQGSDMDVDCFLTEPQGGANSNQRAFNQKNLYNQGNSGVIYSTQVSNLRRAFLIVPLPTSTLCPAGPSQTLVGAPLITPVPKKPINFNFDEDLADFDWGSSEESRPCDQRFHANLTSEGERRTRSLSAPGLDLDTIPEDEEVPIGGYACLDTILERINGVQNTVDQSRKEYREVMKAMLEFSAGKGRKKLKKTPKPKDPRDKDPFRMNFLVSVTSKSALPFSMNYPPAHCAATSLSPLQPRQNRR